MAASTVQTFNLGLIGYPLSHSLSPALQHAALHACRLTGRYDLYPVTPEAAAELEQVLDQVRAGEIAGLNVTIPHKQTVLRHLDQLTPTAAAIGAVNTIYLRDGLLTGDNTDAPAFMADLRSSLLDAESPDANRVPGSDTRDSIQENQGTALVLGAGGAARAVVYVLGQSGWRVTVAARRAKQAEQLVADFPGTQPVDMSGPTFQASRAQLIVNTTPLGMSPKVEASPWPVDVPFPADAMVYDLIYNPRETVLVRRAQSAGLRAASGLGMLIEQAALAFEIWTRQSAPRAAMQLAADEAISAANA